MRYLELNTKGDYTRWEDYRLRELVEVNRCRPMGNLFMINKKIKVWKLELLPGERISFMKHRNMYNWSCESRGMAVMANTNGRTDLLVFEEDDFGYVNNQGRNIASDIKNIGDEVLSIHILEYL